MPEQSMDTEKKTTNAGEGRPTVLIIEDDEFLRDLVAKKLEVSDFTVLQAIDGAQAFSLLHDHHPDVILLDMVLPGMSGLDILKTIKSNPETRSIAVVILSNLGQKMDIDKAHELGAAGYMVKAHTDLNEIVKMVISIYKSSHATTA